MGNAGMEPRTYVVRYSVDLDDHIVENVVDVLSPTIHLVLREKVSEQGCGYFGKIQVR